MELLLPAWGKIKFGVQISVEDAIRIFGTFGEEMCNVHMHTSCKSLIKNTFGFLYNLPQPSIFLWCFDLIPVHCLQLQGFAITPIWHPTLSRNPLDEWSARRTDLYLTIHNIHKRQTSLPPVGFEPTIPASQQPRYRAVTGISNTSGNYTFPLETTLRNNYG
jgi:hypothetical protein